MGLRLVVPPAVEPIGLDETKDHLRITDPSEDELVAGYIVAARQTMEASREPGLDIALITQTWALILDQFPNRGTAFIEVPKPPLQSVTSVTYVDAAGVTHTMPSSGYDVDNDPPLGPGTGTGRIVAVSGWPPDSLRPVAAITITIVCGFGSDPSSVPAPLRLAQKMLVGTFFEQREATGDSGDVQRTSRAVLNRIPLAPFRVPYNYDMLTGLYRREGFA